MFRGKISSYMDLSVFLAGIFSLLLLLGDIPGITFSSLTVYAAAAGVSVLLWNFLNFHPKIFKFALAAVGTGTLGFLFCFWPSVRSQFSAIIASFTDASGETVHDITLAAMFFAAFFVFILFVLEFLLKCHWPVYVVTLPVFAAAPVFGVSCGFFSVTFMVIFHVFFTARQCMKTRKRYSFSYKFKPGTKRENNIPAAMACFAVLIFVISMLVVSVSPQSFYNIVYTAEGFVYRNARQLSSNESDPVATGLISTGNNYRTGEVQMDVYASRQPTEPVYLKTFSGGDYTGGQWTEADDGPIFSNIALALGWQRWADWVQPLYDSLYYIMNDETAPEGTPDPITLTVHHTSGDYYNYYLPYNGYWSMYFQNYGQGYTYNYYEGKDMHIDWENYQPQFEVRRNWYAMIQQEYMKESVDVYTGVPEDLVPRLVRLYRENPMEDESLVTAFIHSVLENTTYTLTPGRVPQNSDIVEYFLFENQKGYCVHYASAATLMYRMYHIPARYASGYVIDPSAFSLQENGVWLAHVTDESAHAWTEIFIEDRGWPPVEFTPSGSQSYGSYYPGFDLSALDFDFNIDLDAVGNRDSAGDTKSNVSPRETDSPRSFGLRFISIISQAAYGPDPTDPMDELFAADIYTVTAKYISSGMSLKKRLIFKYVKGF